MVCPSVERWSTNHLTSLSVCACVVFLSSGVVVFVVVQANRAQIEQVCSSYVADPAILPCSQTRARALRGDLPLPTWLVIRPVSGPKNRPTVVDQELHNLVLLCRIRHFARDALRAHNRRRKYNRHVHTRHKILFAPLDHSAQMDHQMLQHIPMHLRQIRERKRQRLDTFPRLGHAGGLEDLVVDLVCDEWIGEAAEVLLQTGGHGVDVEVFVREVEVLG